eukprot:1195411-Prorocentrum_minimum.AAC.8
MFFGKRLSSGWLSFPPQLDAFVRVAGSIPRSAAGGALRRALLEAGAVRALCAYLAAAFGSHEKGSGAFAEAVARPGVARALAALSGLCTDSASGARAVGAAGMLPLLHRLEGVSAEGGAGIRAETLLEVQSSLVIIVMKYVLRELLTGRLFGAPRACTWPDGCDSSLLRCAARAGCAVSRRDGFCTRDLFRTRGGTRTRGGFRVAFAAEKYSAHVAVGVLRRAGARGGGRRRERRIEGVGGGRGGGQRDDPAGDRGPAGGDEGGAEAAGHAAARADVEGDGHDAGGQRGAARRGGAHRGRHEPHQHGGYV